MLVSPAPALPAYAYRLDIAPPEMMNDGYIVGDGSWELKIHVTDLQVERTLRVKGDLHIGGVMFKLVEDLGNQHHHYLIVVLIGVFLIDRCGRRLVGSRSLVAAKEHLADANTLDARSVWRAG